MIDTALIRANLTGGQMCHGGIYAGTHFQDCKYSHYECAIYNLCDELDHARVEVATLKKQIRQHDQYTRTIGEVTYV